MHDYRFRNVYEDTQEIPQSRSLALSRQPKDGDIGLKNSSQISENCFNTVYPLMFLFLLYNTEKHETLLNIYLLSTSI